MSNLDKDILEAGNIAIARFMGDYKFDYITVGDTPPERLRYHSDWNQLMGVVEKIRLISVGDNRMNKLLSYKIEMECHAKSFSCRISKSWWEPGQYNEENICARRDTTSLIDVTYKAVIKFIQWYNNQSKQ